MKCICPTRDAELDYADRFMNFLNRFNENWHTLGSDSLNSIPNWIHSIHDVKGRFRAHGAQISALLMRREMVLWEGMVLSLGGVLCDK